MKLLQTALVVVLSLSLVSCSSSQVITSIQVTADLIAVSAPVVAAAGNPVAAAYLTTAATATNCVLTAAEAPGATNATIGAAFGTCFSSVVVPDLPAGTSQEVITIVSAVNASIALLIAQFGPRPLARARVASAERPPSPPVKLTWTDRSHISKMRSQLDHAVAVLHR
jgi:hypothetical protein